MRSGGLLVGVASLRHDAATRPLRAGVSDARCGEDTGARGAAYLSGFRIVRDASSATRHAEYRVVLVNARYERWHRFSEIKALAGLLAMSGDSMPDASREAWNIVRACKAPKRRVLDPSHLSRKCLAIEMFLSSLLEKLCAFELAGLLMQVPGSTRAAPRTKSWAPTSYLGPALATCSTAGLEMHNKR